jgi:hypothetical protein
MLPGHAWLRHHANAEHGSAEATTFWRVAVTFARGLDAERLAPTGGYVPLGGDRSRQPRRGRVAAQDRPPRPYSRMVDDVFRNGARFAGMFGVGGRRHVTQTTETMESTRANGREAPAGQSQTTIELAETEGFEPSIGLYNPITV